LALPRVLIAVGVAGLLGGTWWMVIPPAAAAFPGANGDIAFVSTRNNNVAIYQVNPSGTGIGTATGDEANTTPLTNGAVDAEPFYSPDGNTVFFSSNRSGRWAIYSIPQSAEEPPTSPTELSQVSGSETQDDYSPSVAPDGETVVFNRNNSALYTLYASTGPSSVCLLYTPPDGLAAASSDNGSGSRAVFDPQDPSKLLYVSGDNHIHLLSGIPTPSGHNPCGVSPGSLTDVDLSALATAPAGDGITGAADANPDWNPAGIATTSVQIAGHNTNVIFDSTRGGGHTLWTMDLTTATPSVQPLWSGLAAAGKTADTEPVFSPDGNYITYTQPVVQDATQVEDYELDQVGMPNTDATDLTLTTGTPANSQPDWQPTVATQTPEAPVAILLPAGGLLVLGTALGWRRRRSSAP
jgi:MYXO-CTERM domain-containing protein